MKSKERESYKKKVGNDIVNKSEEKGWEGTSLLSIKAVGSLGKNTFRKAIGLIQTSVT